MDTSKDDMPTPGSKEAVKAGCQCPVFDNRHGNGFDSPPKYWISEDCPLHAGAKEPNEP